jgi:hypothetical protein
MTTRKSFTYRTISFLLALCITAGLLPVFTYAAEITSNGFNPINKDLEIEFRFDNTQRANIEVKVDNLHVGYLAKDYEIEGSIGPLAPHSDWSFFESRSVNQYILPNASLETTTGGETHVLLKWDGRINGIPVIGASTKDYCTISIIINAQGYPERSVL